MRVFAQPSLVVVIDSDTTWDKADSPYELTGPVRVNNGATLTIEAGVTIDFNNYEMRVEGTFVCGGDWDQVYLNNGLINLTTTSNGWNQQTKSGHIIQNTVMDKMDLSSKAPIKIINCNSEKSEITATGPSVIQDNTIGTISIHGDGALIQNNKIGTLNVHEGNVKISHHIISYINCKGGSLEISDCTIKSLDGYGKNFQISNNQIGNIGNFYPGSAQGAGVNYFDVQSAEITNNVIQQGAYVSAHSAKISNNVFQGYVHGKQLVGGHFSGHLGDCPIIAVIEKGGLFEVSYNTLTGHTYEYSYDTYYMWRTTVNRTTTTSGINVYGGFVTVANNTITDCSRGIFGGTLIEGNNLINNRFGIQVNFMDSEIRSNTITSGENGISVTNEGFSIIENNVITKQTRSGIYVHSHSIQCNNNTITSCPVALELIKCDSATINYNNIEDYNNSIYLTDTYGTIDATNNWWGTTDTETIGLSIHDSKYSLDLGTVNFTPFLTEPNPNAQPKYIIPEFPTWTILPLAAVIILVAIIFKKKIP
ncbi:MAG: right-handed parallel beta-helix repeat-containing protein [Candidatus Bathyarchaeum tardum]|nr:MAG: right-handed parallel beta-helix repeat-containing protein [Candidatus Bathyarchaeum tardum]